MLSGHSGRDSLLYVSLETEHGVLSHHRLLSVFTHMHTCAHKVKRVLHASAKVSYRSQVEAARASVCAFVHFASITVCAHVCTHLQL